MKYMGGKYFLCKEISSIMKSYIKPDMIDGYLEPFCGALNVLLKMNDYKCIASDYHPDLIQLWIDLQNENFIPPENIDEKYYNECKLLESPNSLKGFVGFGLSFGGKYFSGYADKYKNNKKEDFLKESINSINKIKSKLKNIEFNCCNYYDHKPNNLLIYCDPPYQKTKFPIRYRTDVKHYDIFDNNKFWDIMRDWSKNNYVFISETSAPDDFIVIWEKKTHRSASQSEKTRYKNNSDTYKTEKLFVHNECYQKLIKINNC